VLAFVSHGCQPAAATQPDASPVQPASAAPLPTAAVPQTAPAAALPPTLRVGGHLRQAVSCRRMVSAPCCCIASCCFSSAVLSLLLRCQLLPEVSWVLLLLLPGSALLLRAVGQLQSSIAYPPVAAWTRADGSNRTPQVCCCVLKSSCSTSCRTSWRVMAGWQISSAA